ncbi:TonB-dependent receptor [Sinomicrobium soli]|uniref:TonB-dependent receptor n=1 Tax=Sinomicrobium sp. N-1-3-6 TaxID=2219864 RepID=UPI000DCF441B|nr:TonB-dependent receptor [Sinomicrobium sp. N-1-3-6]RAV29085.1 hypothetical protein DN748_09165 [Sinomicrobium sp. N-1-3-6]
MKGIKPITAPLPYLLLLMSVPFFSTGQTVRLDGSVRNEQGQPLQMVSVYTREKDVYTYTDTDGRFELLLKPGEQSVISDILGYRALELRFHMTRDTTIPIVLKTESLELSEVVVTGEQRESIEGSSTFKIDRQAIRQIHARSLGDILTLLPGSEQQMGNLNTVQQANLRSAVASQANAFGTAVIIDGARISNDADMQVRNPSSSFSLSGNTTAARGIDLRGISANSIETVEVVNGVASPKYGNMSSGAIIVKQSVGRQPLTVQTNITPTTYQAGLSRGIALKNGSGILFTDLSYLYSTGSATEKKNYYQNLNLGLRWRTQVSATLNWFHTTALQLYHSDDGLRHEPDEIYKNVSDVKSTNYRINLNGSLDLLGKLDYNFSGSLNRQTSYFESLQTNGPLPFVEALEPGTYFTGYSPLTYEQVKKIEGQPVSIDLRVESVQKWLPEPHTSIYFDTGIQYTFDKNTGKGRAATNNIAATGNVIGSRSARFHRIPASETLSAYHETKVINDFTHWRSEARIGVRYDYMLGRYNLWSPRLSYKATVFQKISLRAAWGKAYRAPAMIELHPGPTYIDFTNLGYYAPNPDERLAVVTTHVYYPDNSALRPSTVTTREAGIDWENKDLRINLTYYRKDLDNGIYHSPELIALEKDLYTVTEQPENLPPVVEATGETENIARTVQVLKNEYFAKTRGLEVNMSFPRIPVTDTRFSFRMAHIKTRERYTGYDIGISNYVIGDARTRFGVYENPDRTTYLSRGTLTAIQHIPSLRLVFTIAGEMNFRNYSQRHARSLYPYAYYDHKGILYPIPEDERASGAYDDLRLSENTFTPYEKPPFHTNFNLQIRKETASGHSFSFFANNFLWKNPTYVINGNRRYLNDDLTVGFSMLFRIGSNQN